MSQRNNPSPALRKQVLEANAERCCVCKRAGVGLHLHHIDGDSSNTIFENLAVLCVQDHDHHHRPSAYPSVSHLDLSSDQLLRYKQSWEAFVYESKKDNPSVAAIISVFGDCNAIHSAKIIFQWSDERIEFERTYHLLDGDFDFWTNEMIREVQELGKNIKLILINAPLPVEYCECCGKSLSKTLVEGQMLKYTSPEWENQSIVSIFINPINPSLAVSIALKDKHIYSGSLHLCQGIYLHYRCDYYDERVKVRRKPSIRTQATRIVQKVISEWNPAHILIGTGDHDTPTIIDDFTLPIAWESRPDTKSRKRK